MFEDESEQNVNNVIKVQIIKMIISTIHKGCPGRGDERGGRWTQWSENV
jgi:hypothetical protein